MKLMSYCDKVVAKLWMILVSLTMTLSIAAPAHAWRYISDGATFHSGATAVALDASGDAFVSGAIYDNGERSTLIKVAGTTGFELWRREIGASGQLFSPFANAIDPSGDIIVVGEVNESNFSGLPAFGVVKVAGATGAELWRFELDDDGGGSASAVAIDAAGDVIVGGTFYTSHTDTDIGIIKLAGATGAELWRQRIDGASHGFDYGHAVTIDTAGDVFAVGSLYNTTGYLIALKLSGTSGDELWRQEIGGGSAETIAIDHAGDALVAGSLGGGLAVIKFAGASGAELWRHQVITPGTVNRAYAVTVDNVGDVFAAGNIATSIAKRAPDFAVLKLAGANGAEIWRRQIEGSKGVIETARAVGVDTAGDVVAAGTLHNKGYNPDVAVIKLAGADGTEIWRQVTRGAGRNGPLNFQQLYALALDSADDVVAVGDLLNRHKRTDFAVFKFAGESGVAGAVSGRKLLVKDAADPTKRSLNALLKDNVIKLPAPGSANDPRVAGATLRLTNPSTGESTSFVLPAGSWAGLGKPAGSKGYKYKDSAGANGPCTSVLAKSQSLLKVVCSGKRGAIPFTLDEATQGALTFSIRLGADEPHCGIFGGTISKDKGTTNPGPAGIFIAKNSPSLGVCPEP